MILACCIYNLTIIRRFFVSVIIKSHRGLQVSIHAILSLMSESNLTLSTLKEAIHRIIGGSIWFVFLEIASFIYQSDIKLVNEPSIELSLIVI